MAFLEKKKQEAKDLAALKAKAVRSRSSVDDHRRWLTSPGWHVSLSRVRRARLEAKDWRIPGRSERKRCKTRARDLSRCPLYLLIQRSLTHNRACPRLRVCLCVSPPRRCKGLVPPLSPLCDASAGSQQASEAVVQLLLLLVTLGVPAVRGRRQQVRRSAPKPPLSP